MFYSKLIFYFYCFLTILAVICPIKISFLQFLPGILLMWLYYFAFIMGSVKRGKVNLQGFVPLEYFGGYNKVVIIITILHLFFYPLYINFYTGSSVIEIIGSLKDGVSTYALYQRNFEDAGLNAFSLVKLPFIFGNGILRFFFLIAIFRTIAYGKIIMIHEYICIFLMVSMIIFVGISRGTSFELFDITTVFLFSFAVRRILRGYKTMFSNGIVLKIVLFIIVVSGYFAYNITIRMGDNFSFFDSNDFDKASIVYQISKPMSLVLYMLYSYFLFGLHYTSVLISELFLGSVEGFFVALIPDGITILDGDIDFSVYVNRFIDIGVMWRPDSAFIIQNFGILLVFLMIYLLGFFSKYLSGLICNNLSSLVVLYFIFYFFLSLPVGSFIIVSSANQIAIVLGLLTLKRNSFFKLLKNKNK